MTWRGKVWFETLCVGASCDTTRKPKKINNFKISLIALRESQSSIRYWYWMQRQEEDFEAKNRFKSFSVMVDISVDSDGTGGSSDDWRGRKRWERQVNIILKSWCLLMCLSLDVLIIVTKAKFSSICRRLLDFCHLSDWRRDNEFIQTKYRPELRFFFIFSDHSQWGWKQGFKYYKWQTFDSHI